MNDKFVRARAIDFARKVRQEAGSEPEAQVRLAWRHGLGREPTENELQSAIAFIESQARGRSTGESIEADIQPLALADFCQAIFALNEFIYVD